MHVFYLIMEISLRVSENIFGAKKDVVRRE
jgi:hypothetical protein